MTKCSCLRGLFSTSRVLCKSLVTASLPSQCSPEEPKKLRPPVGASSFSVWSAFRAACRRFACPGEGLIRDGLLQAACGSGAGKSEARLVGRASPLNAYDFPSRSRESRVKTIAVRAWRFSGGLKADWKQMGISPERCRKVTGGGLWGSRSSSEAIARRKALK
jgi:hypothetical protein